MNLKEAIAWAERDTISLFGRGGGSKLAYYVCPWNDEYVVHCNSYMKRNPDVKWVYNTIDKEVVIENLREGEYEEYLKLLEENNV